MKRLIGNQKLPVSRLTTFLLNLERELQDAFQNLLTLENDLRFMKSRTDYILEGHMNTKFFHISTLKHRDNNKIRGLKKVIWTFDEDEICNTILAYYKDLFSTEHVTSHHNSFDGLSSDHIQEDLFSNIDSIPDDASIFKALKVMKPYKAPGPDRLHPFFFKKCWKDVGPKVCLDIKEIFSTFTMKSGWSGALLALIPKLGLVERVSHYRPIGLCNTTFKMVSRIIVQWLRLFMNDIISPTQASFVPGRRGVDNVVVLQELVFHFNKMKGSKGHMVVKLDPEKAYDRLEWGFIRETLIFFKIPIKLVNLILSMISSSTLRVLVNGVQSESFTPTRGIRQGDPLSPYIFIM